MSAPIQPPHGLFDLAPSATLGWTRLVLAAVLLTLLGAVAALIHFIWRRSRQPRVAEPRDPWLVLGDEVRAIPPTAQGFARLERLIREALELRFARGFVAMTTREALVIFPEVGLSSDFQAQYAEFQRQAETAVYAESPLPPSALEEWRSVVGGWIQGLAEGRRL